MQRIVTLVLVLMLVLVVSVWAQEETKALDFYPENSAFTFKPTLAYTVFIPSDRTVAVQARPMGELGLAYIVPVTLDGAHNIRVGAAGGIAEDIYSAGFGLGYAYAPPEVPTIVIGLAVVFQLGWPNEILRAEMYAEPGTRPNKQLEFPDETVPPEDTWLNIGFQGSLDFKVAGGLPAGLIAGYTFGVRDSPDQFFFALALPMQMAGPEETVRRFN